MPEITVCPSKIGDAYIEIDLRDVINELEIDLEEEDVQEAIDDDPESYMVYLVEHHLGGDVTKALIRALKEAMVESELLAFCSKLTTNEKESAA